jgi:hypothetical protein
MVVLELHLDEVLDLVLHLHHLHAAVLVVHLDRDERGRGQRQVVRPGVRLRLSARRVPPW